MIALLWLLAVPQLPAPPATAADSAPRVQMAVVVRPDTVTVGERWVLSVRVRAPAGAEIAFPVGPDSGLAVEAVDPRTIERAGDSATVDRTAVYRLAAWDTGWQAAHLGSVVVSYDGVDRRYAIGGDSVRVRSVLPADTARQVPRPARDIFRAGIPWWVWALLALAAAALGWLAAWWWRRRRRARPSAPLDAYAEAQHAFARLDAIALLEAGERGRAVALNVDVMRDYLAARLPEAERALTSTELLDATRERPELSAPRLAPVLAEADLIKFARRPVTAAHAQELVTECRALVGEVERAVVRREKQAALRERAA